MSSSRPPKKARGARSSAPPRPRTRSANSRSSRPPSSRKKHDPPFKWGWVALPLVLAVLVLGVLAVLARTAGGPGTGKDVEVDLPPGLDAAELADRLAAAGAVSSAFRFSLYLRFFGDASRVVPGPHLVSDDLSAPDLCALLERKGTKRERVTFPEGYTRFDMARRLAEKHVVSARAFLAASSDPALMRELGVPAETAEGYLFPATYALGIDADARDVVRRLKAEHDARVEKLRATYPELPGVIARELGWSLHDVVTLASLVEKEAAVDDERPLVASAFVNRFRDPTFVPKPPKLQSDPSAGYGCLALREKPPSCAGYTGRITPEINHDPANVYSTYVTAGLPPGPIANPGERSLAAAIAPADTRYLYFVAKGGGRHTFSATLAEHNAAVKHLRDLRHAP